MKVLVASSELQDSHSSWNSFVLHSPKTQHSLMFLADESVVDLRSLLKLISHRHCHSPQPVSFSCSLLLLPPPLLTSVSSSLFEISESLETATQPKSFPPPFLQALA
uniref:Uncharacterized protein n=1 Tax=Cucumis sativus TaxID=3659 RepID=A0A0A0L163_CUCSA